MTKDLIFDTEAIRILPMEEAHYQEVLRIHQQGLQNGYSTFSVRSLTWSELQTEKMAGQKLVAMINHDVVGWATLTPAFARMAYRGVGEVSIYIDEAARGRKVGKTLLKALIQSSEEGGLWALHSLILPENTGSIALHQACGFREVGYFERIGFMSHGPLAGKWLNVLVFERRSSKVGLDRELV
ncbi:MAG: GNAT family N-acetyltransferase [Actinomycetaceae bacterium]|nr:GNAT family N-acetyltransferase [Actinomycetaceae bacterium]